MRISTLILSGAAFGALATVTLPASAAVLSVAQVTTGCPDLDQARDCPALAEEFLSTRPMGPESDGQIVSLVLVNPLQPVVTADVFRRLVSRDNPSMPPLQQPLTRPAQLGLWLSETRNDLEPAAIALMPVIGDLITRMADVDGCILARMSGSGGTVFGVFGSSAQAHQAAHELRAVWPGYWVAAAPVI